MPKYTYTSAIPAIFVSLAHGFNATVTRAENGVKDIESSTVVLGLGDVVETVEKIVHAHLKEIDPPVEAPVTPTESAPTVEESE